VPSLPHEAIVELFRNRPVLAAELLAEVFSVALPRFTEARIEPAELADVIPRELRADLLVLLLDGQPVLIIIVEAQLHADPDKAFAWPTYVVGARARYRCPACLLVVTHDAALAARLAAPIVLGPGEASIRPFVLGPRGVPVVTAATEAQKRPELAVLSTMAHGRTDVGLDVAVAALVASAGIEGDERKRTYTDLVLLSLGEAARKALEAHMNRNHEYLTEFARKNFHQGIDKFLDKGALLSLKLLFHQFERRLARRLTESEHVRLLERIGEEGYERVSEVVLDLSPEELAAWLADKNNR